MTCLRVTLSPRLCARELEGDGLTQGSLTELPWDREASRAAASREASKPWPQQRASPQVSRAPALAPVCVSCV